MMYLIQKLLEFSMRVKKSPRRSMRILGQLAGTFSVWYCRRMERRLLQGKWDPIRKYRKRSVHSHRRKRKHCQAGKQLRR